MITKKGSLKSGPFVKYKTVLRKRKKTVTKVTILLVSRMRLELTRVNHTPLKRTRLPIPPPRRNTRFSTSVNILLLFL